jgi:hypothetical protein
LPAGVIDRVWDKANVAVAERRVNAFTGMQAASTPIMRGLVAVVVVVQGMRGCVSDVQLPPVITLGAELFGAR